MDHKRDSCVFRSYLANRAGEEDVFFPKVVFV